VADGDGLGLFVGVADGVGAAGDDATGPSDAGALAGALDPPGVDGLVLGLGFAVLGAD